MSVAAEPKQPMVNDSALPVELVGLTLRTPTDVLLDDVSVTLPAGKITLIVGCSGVGKSLLLRALAGLLDAGDERIVVEGNVRIGGRSIRRGAERRVGIVFQHFALLDELSPAENVRIARDHGHARRDVDCAQLLGELEVPSRRPTGALSGGQRQRLAIARALAFDAPVLLYDEPTSGLDCVTARQVASRIRRTNDDHGKTSVIVTHDFESLLPIADEVLVLDPTTKSLRRIEREHWADLPDLLRPPPREVDAPTVESLGRRVTRATGGFLAATSRVAEQTIALPLRLLPVWRSPYWGLRFLLHYLRLVVGPTACIYLLVTGAIAGLVTTYFTFRFLPYGSYTEPLLVEDLLESMGFALYRIIVPLLGTLLIAARCGAAVASDVGAKSYGNQLEAMRSLSIRPERYLLTSILYSFLLGVPLLIFLAYAASSVTSLLVFCARHPQLGPDFWSLHFHRRLVVPDHYLYDGWTWLSAKLLICAAGIALIAYRQGAGPKPSSGSVSRSITGTILWSTLFVLLVHFVFAFLEFG